MHGKNSLESVGEEAISHLWEGSSSRGQSVVISTRQIADKRYRLYWEEHSHLVERNYREPLLDGQTGRICGQT